jgi:cobalt-zinc-cadmium efflux system outer membrane protein
MIRRTVRGMSAAGLLCLAGCLYPVVEKVDATVCELAAGAIDLQPIEHAAPLPQAYGDASVPAGVKPADETPPPAAGTVQQTSWQAPDRKAPAIREAPKRETLTIPDELLPGGKIPDIVLPRLPRSDDPKRKEKEEERRKALERLFPPLPPVGEEPPECPGPEGLPLTLSDLQRLALANSPLIRQAAARVKEMEGAAIQAGLPPNPILAYEGDTMGTTGGPGYQGGFLEQKIIVANKLQLQRAAATMDLKNAELALVRAQTDLATRVRGGYFAVLVAKESVRLNRALVKFTNDVYDNQVKQVLRGGLSAPYEPMYLRSLAAQARLALVQARNRRTSAWKQLAAAIGLPGLPPTTLAGRIDIPVPLFDNKCVLAHVLAHHTDLLTAGNALQQAYYNLELAKVTPIPDPTVHLLIQKDRTGPPFAVDPSVQVSIPIPIWDHNQGGILQQQAVVVRQSEEAHRVRTELTRTLSEAFERYDNARIGLRDYRDLILPDLVRVYRGVYTRYQRELPAGLGTPGGTGAGPTTPMPSVGSAVPGFNDLVVAQQNLAGAVATYITTLGQLWQAVVDVADLMQTKDLFGAGAPVLPVAEIPDLEKLPPLPCCHPCSPLPGAHQKVLDGTWPTAEPGGSPQAAAEAAPTRPATLPPPSPEPAAPPAKEKEKPAALPPGVDPLLLGPPPLLPRGME